MRSSWICCAAASGTALALALLLPSAAPAARKKPPDYSPEEVTNFLLPPEYSLWLVGPVSWIATEQEVAAYLALRAGEEAERFIADFWRSRRDEAAGPWSEDQPAVIFASRADEADRRFSEGTRLGRHTDRGTIFVLYGEPEEIEYQTPEERRRPPVEVWEYPKDASSGLDGRQPKRKYYFAEKDGRTVFSSPVPPARRRPI